MPVDTLMTHSISTSTINNATKFSHHSIQGHYHGTQGVERFADKVKTRWSMTVGTLMDPDSPAARYGATSVTKIPILGCGLLIGGKGSTLVISDLHLPYQHCDAFNFLDRLATEFKVKRVLCVGDIYDNHRGSYHESEADAMGEEEEYETAMAHAKTLQGLFPNMVITLGNHDIIPRRKAKTMGLPSSMLSNMNKLFDTKSSWKWKDHYMFDSWGSYPMTVPMILDSKGRWDENLPKVG